MNYCNHNSRFTFHIPMQSNHPLKVLILPSWYPTERYPMGGIFCQEQARALNDCGQSVDVLVLFVDRAPVGEWLRSRKARAELRREGSLKVYRMQMPRLPGVW